MVKTSFYYICELIALLNYSLSENSDSISENDKLIINNEIKALQIAADNHEKLTSVTESLNRLKLIDNDYLRFKLEVFEKDLKPFSYDDLDLATFDLLWQNPLGRKYETLISTKLLTTPTQEMEYSVRAISLKIHSLIINDKVPTELLERFFLVSINDNTLSLGKTKYYCDFRVSIQRLLKHSENNEGEYGEKAQRKIKRDFDKLKKNFLNDLLYGTFETKMWIHFNFSRCCFKDLELDREKEFFKFHSDKLTTSPLYISSPTKGRLPEPQIKTEVKSYGLDLDRHRQKNFLSQSFSTWKPDCLWVRPDYSQAIVRDMIFNDTPYISGYSGMFALFYPQMLGLSDDLSDEFKVNYFASILSYIVGGGFHSMHEVISPVKYWYLLFPGYKISEPNMSKLASSPKYRVFFEKLFEVSPSYKEVYDASWLEFTDFLVKDFFKFKIHDQKTLHNLINKTVICFQTKDRAFNESSTNETTLRLFKEISKIDSHNLAFINEVKNSSTLDEVTQKIVVYLSVSSDKEFLEKFLNEIKNDPELISYFNDTVFNGKIFLDSNLDYLSEKCSDDIKVIEDLIMNFGKVQLQVSNNRP